MRLETLLFFGVMGLVFCVVIIFAVIKIRRTNSFRQSLIQSFSLAILLYGIACIWVFFFRTTDGLAQLFGVVYYGIAFAINALVIVGILYLLKKNND
jgi:uncharacterized membrane protein